MDDVSATPLSAKNFVKGFLKLALNREEIDQESFHDSFY